MKNKKQTLEQIRNAGEIVATGMFVHSCPAMTRAGIDDETLGKYLPSLDFCPIPTVHRALVGLGLRPGESWYGFVDEDRLHRLMMLAWFHEMVRSGEVK